MDQTFLRNLILVANPVELQTGAEVVFATLERLDILSMILLQKDGGLGG